MGVIVVTLVTAGIGAFIHKVTQNEETKKRLTFKTYYDKRFMDEEKYSFSDEDLF